MTEKSFVDSNSSNAIHYLKNSEDNTKIFGEEITINDNNESKNNNNDSDIESLRYKIPDGGYGWAIVFATFAVNSITLGYGYTWGIYQDYYYKYVFYEQTSTSVLLFIGSISTSSIFLLGPISTYMIDRFGHRPLMIIGTTFYAIACLLASFSVTVWQLFLTQGLLWGISSSIVFYTVIALPSLWFDKRRGVANGIAISGSGIGSLIYSPVLSKLLTELGHRWTIRIFGLFGTILLLISTALVHFPPNYELKDNNNNNDNPDNEKNLPSKKKKWFDFGIFKIPEFVGVAFASLFIPFGFLVPFYLLPSYAAHIGISEGVAASIVGIASGANALGRVILGYMSDKLGRTNTFFLCSFLSGIAILLIWTFSTTLAPLLVFAIIYGLNAGGFVSLFPVVLVEIVGYDNITNAVGFAYFIAAFGTAFGSPIAGALLDLSRSRSSNQGPEMYFLLKMYSGFVIIFGSLFLFWVKLRLNKNLFKKV